MREISQDASGSPGKCTPKRSTPRGLEDEVPCTGLEHVLP
jgi:hypothetical protein